MGYLYTVYHQSYLYRSLELNYAEILIFIEGTTDIVPVIWREVIKSKHLKGQEMCRIQL